MNKTKVDPRKEEYTKRFKSELISFVKSSKKNDHIIAHKIIEIESFFESKVYLMGKVFYELSKEHTFDINRFCNKVFSISNAKKITPKTNTNNALNTLLSPFLNSQKTFHTAADIGSSRLTRILSSEKENDIYADEIYGIAVAIGVEPLMLFEYFFEKSKHSTYDLALKILELYVTKENKQSIKDAYKDTINLNANQEKIIQEIIKNKNTTIEKLSTVVGINTANIQKNLKKLIDFGIIKRIGPKKGGHWIVIERSL